METAWRLIVRHLLATLVGLAVGLVGALVILLVASMAGVRIDPPEDRRRRTLWGDLSAMLSSDAWSNRIAVATVGLVLLAYLVLAIINNR